MTSSPDVLKHTIALRRPDPNNYESENMYCTVKNFGGKKVWRIRTVGSLVEKTLAH